MKKEYKLLDGRTAVFEYDANGVGKITVEAMDYLIDMLPKWIPCSERMPECDYTDVLICVHDKRKGCENDFYVIQAYTVGKHWEPTLHVDMTDLSVVAWMPLPEPYREETES